ncbi:hypothetical protein DRO56_02365 [Candidatus Bathyarchaeota archaeon]|nr:MAG: ribbon-helix-helix protein, CopG family [Candidatus Bathyarchaeota archaeon]RLI33155.1 MAG: hypothetical protein DRO56_02365 [Candidatus Bathyarchaeota archaeon]
MDTKDKSREPIEISKELLKKIDDIAEKLGYTSREEFIETAIRRLIDKYLILGIKTQN